MHLTAQTTRELSFTNIEIKMYNRKEKIGHICSEIEKRLYGVHIDCFEGMDKPLFLISEAYPGIWLEHVYDSVFLAKNDPSMLYLAENTVNLFIDYQKEDGQLPCLVYDAKRRKFGDLVGYNQIQECVSFARLAFMVYEMNRDSEFLKKAFESSKKWVEWLKNNRMTTARGLIEMFVGYDTGHDNSGRLKGLSCEGYYVVDGEVQNASVLPPLDEVAPILAVDMNCNFYSNLVHISKMACELGLPREAERFAAEALAVKEKLFELCYDEDDDFFYDVDKNGQKRRFLSSTIFHLFLEGVLDREEDAELIDRIYKRHISNPEEFATPYPYPSMAVNDPSCKEHADRNCWGYYSQGLIALRATLWMEKYGYEAEFDNLCKRWVEVWTDHFDNIKLAQEIDPLTGIPTRSSEWYSSTMLFYLYAVKRLAAKNIEI